MKQTLLAVLLIGLSALSSLAQSGATPAIRYVRTDGTNTDPSVATSWATSTTDLQGAIDASEPGDAVWIAAGTYKPGGPANTDRTISFTMKNGVAIYGGFAGNETLLSERPTINPVGGQPSSTTLSGEIGTVGYGPDNSYHVIHNENNGLNNTAILDGVVITAGNTDGSSVYQPDSYGAGMFNQGSSPRLTNVSFQGNAAAFGGGMANYRGSSPSLTNCSFQANTGYAFGGAMYNESSSPVLTNVVFQGNSGEVGAGMNNRSSNPVLTNVSFLNNTAEAVGGVMYNQVSSHPSLTNCVLFGNGGSNTFYNVAYEGIASSVRATYSLFDTGAETGVNISGPGNLTNVTSSPFASPTSVALLPCSPAINAGSNAANTSPTDLVGNPRLFGGTIDMGAVELQSLPSVAIIITQQPASGSAVCAGETVAASVSVSGDVSSYAWYKDGQVLSPAQPTASLILTNVQSSQTGSYQLVITSACNSVTSPAFSLTVNAPPTVSISPSSTTLYSGQSVTLTASGATSYVWTTGAASSAVTISALVGTTPYSVTGTDGKGCSSTATAQVTGVVLPALRAPASLCIKSTGSTKTQVTLSLPMTLTGGIAPYTYNWAYKAPGSSYKAIPSGGTSIGKVSFTPVANSPSLTLSGEKGNLNGLQGYVVQLTVTDKNGKAATATTLLDGSCILPGGRQGVEEASLQVRLFPNPVVDMLQLEVNGLSQPAQVRLYDIQGRTKGEWSLVPQAGQGTLRADVSALGEGLYILRVQTQEGVLHSSRVLKQR